MICALERRHKINWVFSLLKPPDPLNCHGHDLRSNFDIIGHATNKIMIKLILCPQLRKKGGSFVLRRKFLVPQCTFYQSRYWLSPVISISLEMEDMPSNYAASLRFLIKLRHYGIDQLYLRKVPWYLID